MSGCTESIGALTVAEVMAAWDFAARRLLLERAFEEAVERDRAYGSAFWISSVQLAKDLGVLRRQRPALDRSGSALHAVVRHLELTPRALADYLLERGIARRAGLVLYAAGDELFLLPR